MSGTCLVKKGRDYFCDKCGDGDLKPNFDFCPSCGEEIVMRWDKNKDCKLSEEDNP